MSEGLKERTIARDAALAALIAGTVVRGEPETISVENAIVRLMADLQILAETIGVDTGVATVKANKLRHGETYPHTWETKAEAEDGKRLKRREQGLWLADNADALLMLD